MLIIKNSPPISVLLYRPAKSGMTEQRTIVRVRSSVVWELSGIAPAQTAAGTGETTDIPESKGGSEGSERTQELLGRGPKY
jgi:hypothetical protein